MAVNLIGTVAFEVWGFSLGELWKIPNIVDPSFAPKGVR